MKPDLEQPLIHLLRPRLVQEAVRGLRVWMDPRGCASTDSISIAQWETELTQSLPDSLKGSLPSIEEIEAELSGDFDASVDGGAV